MDQLLSRLDRIAAGRQAGHVIAEDMRDHPWTARAFRWIRWILIAETIVGATAVAIALTLAEDGVAIAPAVWFRSFVVLAMTITLYYFAWRASAGYWWAYSRLRLFSQIFPIVTLVVAAIPAPLPALDGHRADRLLAAAQRGGRHPPQRPHAGRVPEAGAGGCCRCA